MRRTSGDATHSDTPLSGSIQIIAPTACARAQARARQLSLHGMHSSKQTASKQARQTDRQTDREGRKQEGSRRGGRR